MEAIRKALKRNGITRKKKTSYYKEQNKEKVKEYLEKIENIPQEKINYVDECGIQGFLHREYAYAPRGEKVYDSVSGKKYRRTNIVAAKRGKEIIAPWQYDCSMNAMLFEEWFEQKLIPELSEYSVIVMDNASFHRKKRLYAIAEKHHMILIFLPPYSPELNPIEHEWANMKRWLKYNLHRFDTLDDAISYYFKVD